jgi:uncharacterized phage protein (TIGR01671 family)
MKQIKFRGKAKGTGNWIYGYYIRFETRQIAPMGDDKLSDDEIIHLIARDSFADWNMPKQLEFTPVDPETVGQSTGLKDIDGNEIYEGDVIEGLNEINMVVRLGEYKAYCPADQVVMKNVGFYAQTKDYTEMPLGPTKEYAQKIGNIYDNPELLEASEC